MTELTFLFQEQDLLAEIDSLHKSRLELEQQLHEVSEEKRRLEAELTRQRETLRIIQDREQDLGKDIETLRDENSHHSGTISKLQVHVHVHDMHNIAKIRVHVCLSHDHIHTPIWAQPCI